MKPVAFAYLAPDTIDEALAALARHGEEARVLAGGLSLGAMLNLRLVSPAIVMDVNRIGGLDRITSADGSVAIGALVRQASALRDKTVATAVPLLTKALQHVGHYQTRARGTLAGSVAHADPAAEIPLALSILDGEVELRSRRRTRRVKARQFCTGALQTGRAPDEMIVALHWPRTAARTFHCFREVAMRQGDYALVAAGCVLRRAEDGTIGDLTLGFAGCADRPQMLPAESFRGQRLCPGTIAAAADLASRTIECRRDLHAPAAYRRQLVRTLTQSLLSEARDAAH